ELDGAGFCIMTSGLRSVRDKALTYFSEAVEELEAPPDRLFKIANLFADQIRRVAAEDKEALAESGHAFSANALIGGQAARDREHHLYQIYPEANWVEVGPGTPYHIIGARGYGKPVLDRTLNFDDPMEFALRVGCLAFDSTRISAADVGFPVDIVVYRAGSFRVRRHRYDEADFRQLSDYWQERLRLSINSIPQEYLPQVFVNGGEAADGDRSEDGTARSVP
ncbi:MAG: peptidase, partial [Thermoanaerobaculia bacterium]|nr:peptidase [Thermoanaerobaculia bacterium]